MGVGTATQEHVNFLLARIEALEKKLQDVQKENIVVEERSKKIKAMINDEAFNKPILNKVY